MSFQSNLIFNHGKPLSAYTNASDGNSYPVNMDMRDLVLKTQNQGQTSMCAAYTATSWIESVMWRKTGKPVNYDPVILYNKAKEIDGMKDSEGTTLQAVMNAMIDLGWADSCKRKDISNIYNSNQLKRAIHKYGTCLLGFMITDKWFQHTDKLVFDEIDGENQGGHAVICTGYNDVGVFIQNSWGQEWGKYGFACISWNVFNRQFMCGAYLRNALNDIQ